MQETFPNRRFEHGINLGVIWGRVNRTELSPRNKSQKHIFLSANIQEYEI